MAKKLHFYRCPPICHSMVDLVYDEGGHSLHCCETEMQLLKPKTADESDANHEIVLTHRGDLLYVKVGSKPHPPQSDEHQITTIFFGD